MDDKLKIACLVFGTKAAECISYETETARFIIRTTQRQPWSRFKRIIFIQLTYLILSIELQAGNESEAYEMDKITVKPVIY